MLRTQVIRIGRGRELTIVSLSSDSGHWPNRPFVTLFPAFTKTEREQAEAFAVELLRRGCVELCCLGPEAEVLHDTLDEIIVNAGLLDSDIGWAATTSVEDPQEACEYFVHAAAAGRMDLLAFVDSYPSVQAILKEETRPLNP